MNVSTIFTNLVYVVVVYGTVNLFYHGPGTRDGATPTHTAPTISTPGIVRGHRRVITTISTTITRRLKASISTVEVLSFGGVWFGRGIWGL